MTLQKAPPHQDTVKHPLQSESLPGKLRDFMPNDNGAAMLEFALLFFVFILLILGLIDFSRYYAAKALLTKGTQEGLYYASRGPFSNVDTRQWTISSVSSTGKHRAEYVGYLGDPAISGDKGALQEVIARAEALPLDSAFISTEEWAGIELEQYEMKDPTPGSTATIKTNVAFIRPGESVTLNGNTIYHRTLCASSVTLSAATNGSCKAGKISVADNYQDVLKLHPFMLLMQARVKTVTPFLPDLTVRAQAIGYRELVAVGGFPIPPNFMLVTSTTTTTTTTTTIPSNQTLQPPPTVTTTTLCPSRYIWLEGRCYPNFYS
ncbi:MAG: pilus assembly protein [Deltaproteobacteria bacterium]|nr:pilus assembly protein [Deltaproteobacteria bacterium]